MENSLDDILFLEMAVENQQEAMLEDFSLVDSIANLGGEE